MLYASEILAAPRGFTCYSTETTFSGKIKNNLIKLEKNIGIGSSSYRIE